MHCIFVGSSCAVYREKCRILLQCTKCSRQASLVKRCFESSILYMASRIECKKSLLPRFTSRTGVYKACLVWKKVLSDTRLFRCSIMPNLITRDILNWFWKNLNRNLMNFASSSIKELFRPHNSFTLLFCKNVSHNNIALVFGSAKPAEKVILLNFWRMESLKVSRNQ